MAKELFIDTNLARLVPVGFLSVRSNCNSNSKKAPGPRVKTSTHNMSSKQ